MAVSPAEKKPITTARRLMVNTVLNLLNQTLTVVINFAMIGFFLDMLGEDEYGVWILIGSMFSYRGIMSMGLNSAVNRYIPVHLAQNDERGIRKVVSTAFAYYLFPAFALAAATALLYLNLDSWFAIPSQVVSDAETATLIIGASFATTVPFQVYGAVLSSYQRYDLINLISVSSIVARTTSIVMFLLYGYGILAVAVLYGLTELVIRLLSMVVGFRLMKGLHLSRRDIDRRLLREMLSYGFSTILYMSGVILVFKSADLVIGSLISTSAVSRFFIATTPVLLLTTVVQVFAQAMKPAVSELDSLNDHSRIREMALISQKYTLLAILPGMTFMIVMGHSFLSIWVGNRFPEPDSIEQLAEILQILSVGAGLALTQHTNFIVLVGKGQHKAFGFAALFMIVLCVVFSVASERIFVGGLVGVAWGCSIPMIFVSAFFLPIHFSRAMKIPISESCRESWGPATVATFPAFALIIGWNEIMPPKSWFEIALVVIGAGGLTAVSSWAFAMSPIERIRIRRNLPF